MDPIDYWKECIYNAADECGLVMTQEQLKHIAEVVESGYDNYGMAFYSPPASDMYHHEKREWEAKLKAKEMELETYRQNAETAIKWALRQRSAVTVTIGEHGEVYRHDGRTTQIQ